MSHGEMMMSEKAVLFFGDQRVELPILVGTEGEKAVDISRLRDAIGLITYDSSLSNTSVCKSSVTFIDGEDGTLRYRGVPIEQFTEQPNFIEAAWLLIFGRLPKKDELDRFSQRLTLNELLHEGMRQQFQHIPADAPPMAILSATLSNMACFHPQILAPVNDESFEAVAAQLISQVRTIAAFSYRRSLGLPFSYPDPKLRYCANFMHMMFSIPSRQYDVTPEIEDALNLILLLHADHEQNCSTLTTRVVGSSRANLFASCAAAVCALWGPLHGGASVEVMEMLERIHGSGMSADDYLKAVKDKAHPFELFGFGHRVYKSYDPRARILKAACERVLGQMKVRDPLLDLARKLEELALADPYFVDRKLYPKVDFYSGIMLRCLGIPTNMFTVCFAIGRLPGWIAQWKEQCDDPTGKIIRPRQVYIGKTVRDYVPIENR
jgi:citrate synthase